MKQTITIPIYPIVDAVNAKVHYTARAKSTSAEGEAIISDISEGENEDMMAASLDKATGRMADVIRLYVPVSITRTGEFGRPASEDDQEQAITAELTLPSNYDTAHLPALVEAMAQYCQNAILQDWFAATVPGDVAHYAQQQTEAIAAIRTALTARVRPRYENETPILDTYELIYPTADEA